MDTHHHNSEVTIKDTRYHNIDPLNMCGEKSIEVRSEPVHLVTGVTPFAALTSS